MCLVRITLIIRQSLGNVKALQEMRYPPTKMTQAADKISVLLQVCEVSKVYLDLTLLQATLAGVDLQ